MDFPKKKKKILFEWIIWLCYVHVSVPILNSSGSTIIGGIQKVKAEAEVLF